MAVSREIIHGMTRGLTNEIRACNLVPMGRHKDTDMDTLIQARIPDDLNAELRAYITARKEREPDVKFDLSDAVRKLLRRGLEAEREADKPRK